MDEKKANDRDEFGGERFVMNFSRNTAEPRTIGFRSSNKLDPLQTECRASTYSPAFSMSQLALGKCPVFSLSCGKFTSTKANCATFYGTGVRRIKGGRINNAVSSTTLNVRMECYFSSASYAYFITDKCEK